MDKPQRGASPSALPGAHLRAERGVGPGSRRRAE